MTKISNNIPLEAVMKQVLIENGKLKSEVAYLESELERARKAIAAFKVWQGKVATYQWQYWLNEGVALAREKPDDETRKRLVSFLSRHHYYNRFTKQYERAYHRYCDAKEKLLDAAPTAD